MEIPDLEIFPPDHPPSPFELPVVIDWGEKGEIIGSLPEGHCLLAVGWIGRKVPVAGEVPQECIDRLFDAYEADKVISDGTMGWVLSS
jgi:hypothetical protein